LTSSPAASWLRPRLACTRKADRQSSKKTSQEEVHAVVAVSQKQDTSINPSEPVEAGDPSADARAFRRCLGQYATGVTVVTASADGLAVGVTAKSFSSVSMDPPLVLWSLQKNSQSYDAFLNSTHFAINILSSNQIEISQRFSKSGPDKFKDIACEPGHGDAPILPEISAVLECRREVEHDGGDHLIMVGRVERFRRFDRPALVFERGRYAAAIDHPETRFKIESPESELSIHQFFVVLLNRAYNRMRSAMEEERKNENLDLSESRVLSAISTFPSRSFDVLLPITFLERRTAEDALATLSKKGFVDRGPGGTLTLSRSGSAAMDTLFRNTLNIEKQILASVSDEDLRTTERTLKTIIGSDAFNA
jgi:flavin reductase (DIM6/NTAB) family NADH-FMN oxidoreductase RutF/DNA-binding MarR family transcriptional regulator